MNTQSGRLAGKARVVTHPVWGCESCLMARKEKPISAIGVRVWRLGICELCGQQKSVGLARPWFLPPATAFLKSALHIVIMPPAMRN